MSESRRRNLWMPDELWLAVTAKAKEAGQSTTAWIIEAVRRRLHPPEVEDISPTSGVSVPGMTVDVAPGSAVTPEGEQIVGPSTMTPEEAERAGLAKIRKPMAARPKQRAKSSRRKSAGRQAGGPRAAPAEPGSAGASPPPAPGARKRSAPVVPMSEREGEALDRLGLVPRCDVSHSKLVPSGRDLFVDCPGCGERVYPPGPK